MSYELSAISYQLSAISYQLSVISLSATPTLREQLKALAYGHALRMADR
ncbi:hypothetical protein [Moorena bouillonii]|nr:hypothetical protein [Moorena bouillonii]